MERLFICLTLIASKSYLGLMAGMNGFEPLLQDPKSRVLPLDDIPTQNAVYYITVKKIAMKLKIIFPFILLTPLKYSAVFYHFEAV